MLFNSKEFLLFLAIVLTVYHVVPWRFKNTILLAASYTFYAFWNWKFCALIAFTTLLDYMVARAIEGASQKSKRIAFLLVSVVANLGVLAVFKYCNFFTQSVAGLLGLVGLHPGMPLLHIILPVGVSFYTFQSLSYTIDVYRSKLKAVTYLPDFALYVSFFPQLVAGPIERGTHLLPQLVRPRTLGMREWGEGSILILTGYVRKVLIGDQLAQVADHAFANWQSISSLALWEGLIAFSLQIYFDFSGYSNIARGVARWFGVDLMINFRQPYFSTSISEFWRRWHISLSSWLRDYLYISLGGNRKGLGRAMVNLFITMVLGGLWHGALWTFVVWGAFHGCCLAVHKLSLKRTNRKIDLATMDTSFGFAIRNVHKILATYLLVLAAWLLFRSPDLATAWGYLGRMISFQGPFEPGIIAFIGLMAALLFLFDYPGFTSKMDDLIFGRLPRPLKISLSIIVSIIVTAALVIQKTERPFIYFQF